MKQQEHGIFIRLFITKLAGFLGDWLSTLLNSLRALSESVSTGHWMVPG